eukprot:COSAG06_NODE_1313_length_9887_cov_27.577953_6_plen_110_part_00
MFLDPVEYRHRPDRDVQVRLLVGQRSDAFHHVPPEFGARPVLPDDMQALESRRCTAVLGVQKAQLANMTAALGFIYERGLRGGNVCPLRWNCTDHLSKLLSLAALRVVP